MVSKVFYQGRLCVAQDCQSSDQWQKQRQVCSVYPLGKDRACVTIVDGGPIWSKAYKGPIRPSSAEAVAELAEAVANHDVGEDNVLVLTPFHAQRTLIRIKLRQKLLTDVQVGTVHSAQGSECHTVIFDPVDGGSSFFQKVGANRLVNVAISRAQARLIVVLSSGDCNNPLFTHIRNAIHPPRRSKVLLGIEDLVERGDFPDCAVGRNVQIKTEIIYVQGVENKDGKRWLKGQELGSGIVKRFCSDTLQEAYKGQRGMTPVS